MLLLLLLCRSSNSSRGCLGKAVNERSTVVSAKGPSTRAGTGYLSLRSSGYTTRLLLLCELLLNGSEARCENLRVQQVLSC